MSKCPIDEHELRYQISQIKDLPPLPQAVKRLIEIIQDEVESSEELESIISYDQALAAKVLQIANSTYYGFRRNINNISKAIVIIGFNQVKSICLCALLSNLFSNGKSLDPAVREGLWKHSFTTSRIAVEIAKKRPWLKSEEAALLGLIHDIGHLAMASHFSELYQAIREMALKRKIPPWCAEMQAGLPHTEVGKYLASRWAFPEVMQAVIEFHHSPERCGSHKAEVKLIHLADVLSCAREYPELLSDETTVSSCRDLCITEDEWQEYQRALDNIRPEVDQMWDLLK